MWQTLPRHRSEGVGHHRTVWVGRDLKIIKFQPSAMGRDTFYYTRLLTAPSSLALNTSRNGASTTSLDNVLQKHKITSFKSICLWERAFLNQKVLLLLEAL